MDDIRTARAGDRITIERGGEPGSAFTIEGILSGFRAEQIDVGGFADLPGTRTISGLMHITLQPWGVELAVLPGDRIHIND